MSAAHSEVDSPVATPETLDPTTTEVAGALGRLPALDADARAQQRAGLEAIAGQLYPPPGAGPGPVVGLSWPQGLALLMVLAAGLIALVGFLWQPSLHESSPRPERNRYSAPPARTPHDSAAPSAGSRGILPPADVTSSTVDPPLADGAAPAIGHSAAPGQALTGPTPVGGATPTAGTDAGPARGPIGSRTPPNPATSSVVVRVRPFTTPAPRFSATPSVSVRVACPPGAAPPVPAAPGPWLIGRVQDSACRPVADAVVVFEAQGSGVEFLGRSAPDGSYAIAVEPGSYRAELFGIERWQAIAPGTGGAPGPVAPLLTVAEVDDLRRLDFITQGGGP